MNRGNRTNKRLHATELRRQGHSLSYISGKIGVSRGTLSHWLRDIAYVPHASTTETIKKARAMSAVTKNKRRLETLAKTKESIAKEFAASKVTDRELFFMGIGLLAGRGNVAAERIEFTTSDAKEAVIFTKWLKKGVNVPTDHIHARIILQSSHTGASALDFWSKTTGIATSQIKKTVIDRREEGRKAINPRFSSAPFGSIRIYTRNNGKNLYGVLLFRRIQAIIECIARDK